MSRDEKENLTEVETPDAGSRPGGRAAGGTAPQPGDPTSPAEAQGRAAASNKAMKEAGFGDHKGEDLASDGSKAKEREPRSANEARHPDVGQVDDIPPGTPSL